MSQHSKTSIQEREGESDIQT